MSGKKSKVIRSQINTRSRIVCQYSTVTTTEPSPSRKGNKMWEYYKKEWPAILGSMLGTTMMFLIFYFAALTLKGV